MKDRASEAATSHMRKPLPNIHIRTIKMKKLSYIVILICYFSLNALSQKVVEFSEKGSIAQTNFTTSVPFTYENKHIFIDVKIKGKSYNFLVDTGADFIIVDINHIENIAYGNLGTNEITRNTQSTEKE